jgi:hypothetical protein
VLRQIGADGVFRPDEAIAKCGEAKGWRVLVKVLAPFLSGKPKPRKASRCEPTECTR